MKYFLALDKGPSYRNDERYLKIDLNKINSLLNQDNNLKPLCAFTCTFKDKGELKKFLKANHLIDARYENYDLGITYFKEYYRFVSVPYQADAKFLNPKTLEQVIYEKSNHPNFLSIIIKQYHKVPYLKEEIYSFHSYITNPYADYKLYNVIRSFVNKICFRKNNDGIYVPDFKGTYNLGMLIAKIGNKDVKSNEIKQTKSVEKVEYSEDDPRAHHLEELKERYEKSQDGQMRLF